MYAIPYYLCMYIIYKEHKVAVMYMYIYTVQLLRIPIPNKYQINPKSKSNEIEIGNKLIMNQILSQL